MAPKVAKKKKFTDSNRKSSQRSSSNNSSAPSVLSASSKKSKNSSSKSSMSSKKSKSSRDPYLILNKGHSEKDDVETFKTIYKASDEHEEEKEVSNLTTSTLAWLQGLICLYLMMAIVYQLIWGRDDELWFILCEILLFELFAGLQLIAVTYRPFIGYVCLFLSLQYVLLFLLFSMFLHSSYSTRRPFFEKAFGLSATCLASSAVHFFIVLQSMRFIGESKKRKDYSENVIVEGVEKRRKDLYMMISDLISEICYDDNTKVNLMIRDETGQTKSMRGAGVEAGVNRVLEMSTDGQNVKLSTSSTTLTRINVPKLKHHHHSHHKSKGGLQKELAPIIDSKYNNCSKQEKVLSPRKILG